MHTTPTSSHSNYSLQDMDLSAPGPSRIQTRKRQREAEEDQVLEEFQPLAVSIPNVSCYLSLQQHGRYFHREVFTEQAGVVEGGEMGGGMSCQLFQSHVIL